MIEEAIIPVDVSIEGGRGSETKETTNNQRKEPGSWRIATRARYNFGAM
jgi:hypothetical protein